MHVPGTPRRVRLAAVTAAALAVAGIQLASWPSAEAAPDVDIQIVAANDFHGRIANDAGSAAAGAAAMAGAVNQMRGANPNTVFAMAGDIIGASTFESFIDQDKPTIDALNQAGLDVSSVGNHEFDQGFSDLLNRVMAPFDPSTNPKGGADWQYLASNVRLNSNNTQPIPPTWTETMGGVTVGFIGAVTEHLPELVSPAGISTIHVTDIVTEANAAAADLKTAGADVIVLLVHEGAPMTDCTQIGALGTDTDFGSIVKGVSDNIDAIVSGHTHLSYNCSFPVAGWSGRPVTQRPVVSAGQYGFNLNQLTFTVDAATGQVQNKTQTLVPLKSCSATDGTSCGGSGQPAWVDLYAPDGPTASIVTTAVNNAAVLGAAPLGQIGGGFFRGKIASGSENRGAESTLGNLVAEVQRWATRNPESGSAQLAFMNPGGLRQDMTGSGTGSFPRTLTYQQAAVVQPFANTLVNQDLTGAQIKTVLEQQWQPSGASRPFLKLGISRGFLYTYDDTRPQGSRVTGMWLHGVPIDPAATYSVTANSFLASGGDNFTELGKGTGKQDTGRTDLQAMVDYMGTFGSGSNLVPVDYRQNSVGVSFPAGAPASYQPGSHVKFNVSSWSMTNPADVKDANVVVRAGSTTLGTFPLDNTAQAALPGFDTVGKASVDVVVPVTQGAGPMTLTLTGATTGTTATVPIAVTQAKSSVVADPQKAKNRVGKKVVLDVTVTGENGVPANGQVTAIIKGGTAVTVNVVNGHATINLGKFTKPGKKKVEVQYLGSPTLDPSTTSITFKVKKKK